MNRETSFSKQPQSLAMFDRQHMMTDLDGLWGRRIVPLLDHESEFLRIDQEDMLPMFQENFQEEKDENLLKEALHELDCQRFSSRRTRNPTPTIDTNNVEIALMRGANITPTCHDIRDEFEPLKEPQWPGIDDRKLQRSACITLTNFEDDSVGGKKKQKKCSTPPGSALPSDFHPTPYSIVVGRGKESKNAIGNQRLRVLASNYLLQYAEASDDKQAKSEIVSTLVATIRNACPVGGFIKRGKDGRWYTVGDSVAREKVGYTFRELLGDKYRSSSKAKAAMRSRQRRNSQF
jgi:hypothetical protein